MHVRCTHVLMVDMMSLSWWAKANDGMEGVDEGTPSLHNKIPAQKIFARGWVAQKSFCSQVVAKIFQGLGPKRRESFNGDRGYGRCRRGYVREYDVLVRRDVGGISCACAQTGVRERNTPFKRALAAQSCGRNCAPVLDLVL